MNQQLNEVAKKYGWGGVLWAYTQTMFEEDPGIGWQAGQLYMAVRHIGKYIGYEEIGPTGLGKEPPRPDLLDLWQNVEKEQTAMEEAWQAHWNGRDTVPRPDNDSFRPYRMQVEVFDAVTDPETEECNLHEPLEACCAALRNGEVEGLELETARDLAQALELLTSIPF